MLSIVKEHISQHDLKQLLSDFVEYKSNDGFPFGELLILHYKMLTDKQNNEIYIVAAAIEILVLATDILDDIEDKDCKDKPWLLDSQDASLVLNSTTALLFLSLKVIKDADFQNKDRAISILIDLSLKSIHGQHLDLLNVCKSETEYIEMTIEKSGSIVALSCLIGAVLAVSDYPKEIEIYSKYIGLIAQINNDLNDISSWNDKNDILNKKYTLPIIHILNNDDEKYQIFRNYYHDKVDKDELVTNQEIVNQKIMESGAIVYTNVIKKIYQNKIESKLEKLNVNKNNLDLLLKYIL